MASKSPACIRPPRVAACCRVRCLPSPCLINRVGVTRYHGLPPGEPSRIPDRTYYAANLRVAGQVPDAARSVAVRAWRCRHDGWRHARDALALPVAQNGLPRTVSRTRHGQSLVVLIDSQTPEYYVHVPALHVPLTVSLDRSTCTLHGDAISSSDSFNHPYHHIELAIHRLPDSTILATKGPMALQ